MKNYKCSHRYSTTHRMCIRTLLHAAVSRKKGRIFENINVGKTHRRRFFLVVLLFRMVLFLCKLCTGIRLSICLLKYFFLSLEHKVSKFFAEVIPPLASRSSPLFKNTIQFLFSQKFQQERLYWKPKCTGKILLSFSCTIEFNPANILQACFCIQV